MSGALNPELAQAAGLIALRAEAAARGLTLGRLAQAKLLESLDKHRAAQGAESLPGKTWRLMALRTRTVLVMLAAKTDGDPREVARKPWEALDEADRDSIAACARTLRRDLADVSSLF
ncbi:hypothetical protein QWZ02_09345 [Kinneretia asaccharophila]|uniref:Uncharacterized protein n=1 Tax=Roseateles asaccharophilus TaxID=582607 RepID=A0A4R6N350_9BURK|nr:hypothetical protein [Roseateles asaccharophilus]MDN3544651.1 hypothetical protein [Roseateles asaccharophilus]TDP09583.1 hypothetical protein DFR39_104144 [Roseateles asaccharophilus]